MARLSSDSVSLSNFISETLPPYNNNLQMEELDVSAESRISDPLSVEIPAINDGSKKTKFEKNSLVFAKLSGHSDPPWPARVVDLSWNNGTHCGYEVFFYGTYQVGKVLSNKVWKYNEDSIAKFSKTKIASLRKKSEFFRGLVEIRDCPDIAPSRDVPEAASKIAKKLIRRTANEDDLKLKAQSQTNDVNTESLFTESSSVMTGIKKIGGKLKSSSWILEKSEKRTIDTFTDEDEDYDERSCISEPNTSTARRSERIRKPPYWRRLEAKTNEMAARQIDERAGIQPDKDVKSRYRKTAPAVSSKIQGTRQKLEEKETKTTSVVSPSLSKSRNDLDTDSRRAEMCTTTNNYASSMEMSPRPQMRSRGKEPQQARLPDTDTDSTGNDEALQNSNPVIRRGLNKASMSPGTRRDCVIVKEEPASENPREWTVAQTVAAIIRMEPSIDPEDLKAIRDHKIDGNALLKLSFHDFVKYCQVKVGPAIKMSCLVEKWNTKSQEF